MYAKSANNADNANNFSDFYACFIVGIVGAVGVVGISILSMSNRSSALFVDQNQLTVSHTLDLVLAVIGFRVVQVIRHHFAATD